MGLQIGNVNIKEIYLGNTKIAQMYLGSSKIYELNKKPYFVFEFSVSDFVPTTGLLNSSYTGNWSQVSSSPNRWKLTINNFVDYYSGDTNLGIGLAKLFIRESAVTDGYLIPSNLGNGTCKLIDSGNLDITDSNGNTCVTMDRMFMNCKGLTYIEPIHCSNVQNVGGMFNGCPEVTEGALAQYTWFINNNNNITNHSGTFTNCGSNTQTGVAELAQIPVGWGGTLVPASTLMDSTVGKWKNKSDIWTIGYGHPDWTAMNGLYLFTEASVSSYAGVSMNRSRIAKFNGLSTSPNALYFYPCFMQHTSTAITWAVTTDSPNGSLAYNQANTDMPGTLDYSTYGPFAHEFGTYDSAGTVYFCFLVTDVPISSSFNLSSSPYGVLYNSNFKTNAGLRWFF